MLAVMATATAQSEARFELRALASCTKTYTQKQHEAFARKVYGRNQVTRKAQRRVRLMTRCQHTGRARVNARRLTRRVRNRYKARRSLTPYNCGAHGWFAIPCPIVACESGYSWGAYNPSGATGPYQLLGKGVSLSDPPHVHHRVAASLWAGGAGASHWVCKA